MKAYKTNILKQISYIKEQFDDDISKYKNKSRLTKNNSHSNFINRPKLIKNKYKSIEKTDYSHALDQIGNDDLIFNNDKLITNIQIESFEKPSKKDVIDSILDDDSFLGKKNNKRNSTSIKRKKINRHKKSILNRNKFNDFSIINNTNSNNNTLELNCNKIIYNNNTNISSNKHNITKKNQNNSAKKLKKVISPNKNKNTGVKKNVDQFINKPNERRKTNTKNIFMTPISNKSTIRNQNNQKLIKNSEYHSSQKSFINFNNHDTISVASSSRIDMNKSVIRGRSMPAMRSNKSQSNLRLPNKSIIKNQDKVIMELQKLFGEKIQLNEETYQNMTELDKKNCINFLLETVKELNNLHKINQSKTNGYKQIIESKEQQIKTHKNEIKELKKENLKLNKIIKTNNQLNKKLSQNIENLKLQLEKEKIKNKTNARGKSTSKLNNIYSKKYKNENSINKNRKFKENKSQDKMKKVSGFINMKKTEISQDKKLENNEINKENKVDEKIEVNITWKNNENKKTDVSPNSLISNDSKEQNDFKDNNGNTNSLVN